MSSVANQPVVRVERAFSAPPDRIYRAWLSPELIRRWMAPGYKVTRVEVDERVGGRYRVWHADAGVPAGGFERLDDLAAALPQVADRVGPGWDGVLAKLAAVLATEPR
jgi:hypothetical protein